MKTKRSEALKANELRYKTGKKCLRGHISERYSNNGKCVACCKENVANGEMKEWYRKNKEHAANYAKRKYQENPEHYKKLAKQWREDNQEQIQEYSKQYYIDNRELSSKRSKKFHKDNPGYAAAASIKYCIRRTKRTPCWQTKEEASTIFNIYLNSGDMHVDHIIPLFGKNISGLHVIDNLQLLPASENISKSNRFTDEDAAREEERLMQWLRDRGLAS